jgi:hypothetical protein
MKILVVVWLALAAALLLGPLWPHAPGFTARWVQLPPAMTWQDFQTARAAAARPSFCVWPDFGKCWTT